MNEGFDGNRNTCKNLNTFIPLQILTKLHVEAYSYALNEFLRSHQSLWWRLTNVY